MVSNGKCRYYLAHPAQIRKRAVNDKTADAWHYPRLALAEHFLRRFDPGPAEALTLFAERRSGKTAFLQKDLTPVAIRAKIQPVYIDLWSNRSAPALAIADGFEAAARFVLDPNYKYGSLLGRFNDKITSVGALGVSVGMAGGGNGTGAPTEPIARITFWADQLIAASKRPILLMIDEIQTLATARDNMDIASALRAALQRHGRLRLRPVFTGSSRDGLNRLFNESNAAFFRYGSNMDFPPPDDGIAAFFSDRLRFSAGVHVPPEKFVAAFHALQSRPGPFREMVTAMDSAGSGDVDQFLRQQMAYMESLADARVRLARLSDMELAVLKQIVIGAPVFGQKANAEMAAQITKTPSAVNPKLINDALNKLRDAGIVTRIDRGEYLIEDTDVAALLMPPATIKSI
jgi:hypothetical protein